MNEFQDPFEKELAALRPLDITPELRERIGVELASVQSIPVRPAPILRNTTHWLWRISLVGALAACATGVWAWWMTHRRDDRQPIVGRSESVMPQPVEDSLPTFLAYSRALARSPDVLDALLDKHGIGGATAEGVEVARAQLSRAEMRSHLLTRTHLYLNSGTGELE